MLTVWSVCHGDKYNADDVLTLKDMVRRHLVLTHKFKCLSDREIPGVDTTITPVNWPGWWQKLALFLVETRQCIYLDLDVVVVGNLDRLITRRLSMAANWAQSGHGGGQSSVMSWGDDYRWIANRFDPDQLQMPTAGNYGRYGPKLLWGDQEYITDLCGSPGHSEVVPMPYIYSYKYHCRRQGKPPEDAAVVAFHGEPKPWEVGDQWVKSARSFTATRT